MFKGIGHEIWLTDFGDLPSPGTTAFDRNGRSRQDRLIRDKPFADVNASIDCFGMMDVLIDVALAQRATLLRKELTNFAQNGGVGFSATMTAIDSFPDFGTIHPDNCEIIFVDDLGEDVGKIVREIFDLSHDVTRAEDELKLRARPN